eukprot:TRINITY_DN3545_c0_g1_i4.p1 TRINITY_DN3545_c0_g1~~TRINITY_DN3545_c0_g1_i4.p1  ORF type:complete len:657 (-),score=234.95 TRINITY_DN3545_c0_g1_i4:159-1949(-)
MMEDSDDEDESLPIEIRARKEEARRKAIEKLSQLEEEDARKQQGLLEDEDEEQDMVLPISGEALKQTGIELSTIKERIDNSVRILSDFKTYAKPGSTRSDYLERLKLDISNYYGYSEFLIEKFLSIFSVAETMELIEKNEAPRPTTIRTNTLKIRRRDLAQILINRGVNLDPVKWSKLGLQIFESQIPVGATPEYLAGYYMLQSTSSLLPVMALDPQPNERILDMCAAPGGKTTHIAQLMKNTGVLVANDVNKERLSSLFANLQRMGVKNAIISNSSGTEYPRLMGGFDRILLDAPCSGLGVISRDPSVKTDKTQKDFDVCAYTQKKLILAAIDSLKVNGILVYSTCTISVEENEAIISYALSKRKIRVVESDLPFGEPGFTNIGGKIYHPSVKLGKRYYPHRHNMDGFFVCKIVKVANEENQDEEKDAGKKRKADENFGKSENGKKKEKKEKGDHAPKPDKPQKKGNKDNNTGKEVKPVQSKAKKQKKDNVEVEDKVEKVEEPVEAKPSKKAKATESKAKETAPTPEVESPAPKVNKKAKATPTQAQLESPEAKPSKKAKATESKPKEVAPTPEVESPAPTPKSKAKPTKAKEAT